MRLLAGGGTEKHRFSVYTSIGYNDVVLARAIKRYGGLFDADRVCGPVDTGPRLSKTQIKLDCIFFEGHSKVINIPRVTQKSNFENYFGTSKTDFETRVVVNTAGGTPLSNPTSFYIQNRICEIFGIFNAEYSGLNIQC